MNFAIREDKEIFLLTLNMGSTYYTIILPFGKKGEILTARNFPRKHKDLVLALSEAVKVPNDQQSL